MSESPVRRALPIVTTDAARVVGGLGVLACVLCCVSIPAIVTTISALGLGFLRNDRLLVPAVMVSLVVLLLTFYRSRSRHGQNAPLLMGLAAAVWTFVGLRSPAPFGTFAALSGAPIMVAVVIWDWRLQRRCSP